MLCNINIFYILFMKIRSVYDFLNFKISCEKTDRSLTTKDKKLNKLDKSNYCGKNYLKKSRVGTMFKENE